MKLSGILFSTNSGVDVVETPNGIVCSGGMVTSDPLCTEQFKNFNFTLLKVVTDPGYAFTGWTVNGAAAKQTIGPLLLATMPGVASADLLPPGITEATVDVGCATLEILSPQPQSMYPMSEANYTTTPQIPFQARVSQSGTNWQGDIHWTVDLEYDTTTSRGRWTHQQTFQTSNESIHEEAYVSQGGKMTVTASAEVSTGKILTKQIELTITGMDIPDHVITDQLKSGVYTGATSNLLTGIAAVETEGDYDQFRLFSKYGATALWPNESKSDEGSHIGLMQVAIEKREKPVSMLGLALYGTG
jgi:hypothetical protein